jgi:hydroxypyruvate isomerase
MSTLRRVGYDGAIGPEYKPTSPTLASLSVHARTLSLTAMFEVSANVEYTFHEAGESLEKRVEAAAAAGPARSKCSRPRAKRRFAEEALDGSGVRL